DQLVGAARIVFVGKDLERSEHHSLKIPIPSRLIDSGFVEISRMCTHPDYRGSDVLPVLLQNLGRIVYCSGYRFLLSNCNDNMWRFYKKFGWRKTGYQFEAFGTSDC